MIILLTLLVELLTGLPPTNLLFTDIEYRNAGERLPSTPTQSL